MLTRLITEKYDIQCAVCLLQITKLEFERIHLVLKTNIHIPFVLLCSMHCNALQFHFKLMFTLLPVLNSEMLGCMLLRSCYLTLSVASVCSYAARFVITCTSQFSFLYLEWHIENKDFIYLKILILISI